MRLSSSIAMRGAQASTRSLFASARPAALATAARTSVARGFSSFNNNKSNDNKSNGQREAPKSKSRRGLLGALAVPGAGLAWFGVKSDDKVDKSTRDPATGLPILIHETVFAPNVPAPITRKEPALVRVELHSTIKEIPLTTRYTYKGWTFNDSIPGPFIRLRQGDVMEITHYNDDHTGMQHNIDFHAVMGPGGGAPLTNVDSDDKRTSRFKMLYPGLYVYHCAAGPLPMHVANGMYGLILVEPEDGMEKVDKEFYVMQSEFYVDQSTVKDMGYADFDYASGLNEEPDVVVFNGREGSLTHGNVLQAKVNDKCRIYFGNGGPNLMSTFHVIGAIFEKVYRDGSVDDTPGKNTQSVLVGPGSAAMVEFTPQVPGNYTLVDHAIFRVDKGCVGFLSVKGEPAPEIYSAAHPPNPCPNCKLHP